MGHRVVVLHLNTNPIKKFGRAFQFRNYSVKTHTREGVEVIFDDAQILVPHSFVPFKWQQENKATRMIRALLRDKSDFVPDAISVHFPMSLYWFYSKVHEFFPAAHACAVLHGSDMRELQKRKKEAPVLSSSFDRLLFRSPMLMKKAVTIGVDESKCSLALSGIDAALVSEKDAIVHKAAVAEKKEWRVVYVGKLNAQKCIDTIIYAVNIIRKEFSVHLDIVGDGPDRERLQQLSESLEMAVTITFWGQQSREASVKIMRKADVFVMVSRNETFGLVYVEAMCQGCIAIGSKGEGIDGFIEDGINGFLVEPANVEELTLKFKTIIQLDLEERKNIILNAYSKASMLTDNKAAQLYLKELMWV